MDSGTSPVDLAKSDAPATGPGESPEAGEGPPGTEERKKIIRPWRSRWRQQQHASDHALEAQQAPVLEHALVPQGAAQWVDTPEALFELTQKLRQAGAFVFDTEFIGEDSYHPRVCLVQIATPTLLAIVDPLAVPDLRPLWDLVADPNIEKTVHAGSQDLAFPWRATGKAPANVFDTQIGAAFAGQPHSQGLGKMVQALLGADVGGSAKFTRWDARPLTALQCQYAANDVRYLPAVRACLSDRLLANGNAALVKAACDEAFRAEVFAPVPIENRLKIQALHRWSRPQLGALHALARWREELAMREDLPARILFPDGVLADFVMRVLHEEPLDEIKGLPRPIRQAHLEEMVQVVKSGSQTQPERIKRPKRMTEWQGLAARDLADALWLEVEAACAARQTDPASVTSRKELHRLACLRVADIEPEEPIRVLGGWRATLLGELKSQAPAMPAPKAKAAPKPRQERKHEEEVLEDDGMLPTECPPPIKKTPRACGALFDE